MSIHEYQQKYVGFKDNIKHYDLLFNYNNKADNMLCIVYVFVRHIPCSCYTCLRKLYSPWNRIKYKYNQNRYNGENQQYIYYPILGV